MTLIVSDRHLEVPEIQRAAIELIDLSKLKITNCVGCFGCWTKTPGKCVIRDDAVQVYPRIAASDRLMYVSRVRYGSYDTIMKTMLERAIPTQQAFIRLHHGETHHFQRDVSPKEAIVVGYGDLSAEEQDIFRQLIARNANNMNFTQYRVVFAQEQDLEQTVRNEVLTWERS
uniref:flavodoxin family protein n=1 Tax=uncultured Flavonifractor sp. TaxID=1193534 RepID=UPI002629D853|nr:NAD(P)H-dependent oxidoreductase [uncultured Flavonifractor sp.]